MRSFVRQMIHRLQDELVQSRHELDRWQRAARFRCDLGRCGLRQLDNDRVPQLAAALSFRTLFGLMPLLVVLSGLEEGDVYAWLGGSGIHEDRSKL